MESPLLALKVVWACLVFLQVFLQVLGAFDENPWTLVYLVLVNGGLAKLILTLSTPGSPWCLQKPESSPVPEPQKSASSGSSASSEPTLPQTPPVRRKRIRPRSTTPPKVPSREETVVALKKALAGLEAKGKLIPPPRGG